MMCGRLTCLFFLGICVCFGQAHTAAKDDTIGYVTGMDGSWLDASCNCRVDQGHTVLRGSSILRQGTARASNYLKIRFWIGAKPGETMEAIFACSALNCSEPLDILGRLPSGAPGELTRYLRAALEMVTETLSPEGLRTRSLSGYAATASRGPGEPSLTDAFVFPAKEGGLDLSDVFGKFRLQTPQLDWCEVGPTGKPSCLHPPEPTPATVTRDGKTVWKPPVARPGLYQIFLCDATGGAAVRGNSAFVLVASSADDASKMRKDYRRFAALTLGWNTYERSMLLRAYMQYLNTTMKNR